MSSSASPDTSSDDDNINDARERFGRGANIYEETGKHSNALHDASLQGDLDTVQYLLDKGADINAQGGKYGTALQAASHRGNEDIVRFQLYGGADIDAKGGKYGTALQAASHQGNKSVVRELLHRGAKVNAQGGRYGNALQAASMGGHQEVLELLEKQLDIKQVISNAIDDLEVFHSNEDIKTIVCHVDLEVLACRKMDAEDMDDISRLVTFTRTSRQAQAATCVDYIYMTISLYHHVKLRLKDAVGDNGQPESAMVEITGSRNDVIETLELLSWFAATFREHHGDTMMCSFVNVVPAPEHHVSAESPPHLRLLLLSSGIVDSKKRTPIKCWIPMLCNSILACGFPSAPRTEGLGLEVPPAIMLYLAGVNYPTQWTTSSEGLIFRSGFRQDEEDISMLVPVRKLENAIQWHLVRTKRPLGTSIDEADSDFINGMTNNTTEWYQTNDVDLIMRSRAFLGCWSQAEVVIGTDNFPESNFRSSDLPDGKRTIHISMASSLNAGANVSAGVSGITRLGATLSVPIHFRVREAQRLVIEASQLGQEAVFRNASEQPVLLYDTATKRAWMVAELSVALDMAHHFLASCRLDASITAQLKNAEPSGNGGLAALEAIERCKDVGLWPDPRHEDKQLKFGQLVVEFLTFFQQRKRNSDLPDNLAGIQHSANLTEFPLSDQPPRVWDYQQLRRVAPGAHVEKQIETSKNDLQAWWKILGNQDILVLAGQGFEQIIQPSSDMPERCQTWETIPENRGLLTARMHCLKMLGKNNGYLEFECRFRKSVTSLQWHQPPNSKLFERCKGGESCVRIQELREKESTKRISKFKRLLPWTRTTTISSPTIADLERDDPSTMGAVVFGKFPANEQPQCPGPRAAVNAHDEAKRRWGRALIPFV